MFRPVDVNSLKEPSAEQQVQTVWTSFRASSASVWWFYWFIYLFTHFGLISSLVALDEFSTQTEDVFWGWRTFQNLNQVFKMLRSSRRFWESEEDPAADFPPQTELLSVWIKFKDFCWSKNFILNFIVTFVRKWTVYLNICMYLLFYFNLFLVIVMCCRVY